MSELGAIKARAEAFTSHGTPGQRAPQDRAELLKIITAVEEAVYSAGHADWCDDYWGPDGQCRCWKADLIAALEGAA